MLIPASGTGSDVVPRARVKQEAAAEPEPGCVLGGSNERPGKKDCFEVPAAAQGGLELGAELEGGPDSFAEPEQQSGTDAPIAPGATAADSLGESRCAQTDLNVGPLASTQALAGQSLRRYDRKEKKATEPRHKFTSTIGPLLERRNFRPRGCRGPSN